MRDHDRTCSVHSGNWKQASVAKLGKQKEWWHKIKSDRPGTDQAGLEGYVKDFRFYSKSTENQWWLLSIGVSLSIYILKDTLATV